MNAASPPRREVQSSSTGPGQAVASVGASLSPLIHLIDDDAAVRESLALLIGTVGLRVQTWADPLAFVAGFDRQGIGAIVLDVRMPGLSGLAVLEALQAQGCDQPVVMLTGHGDIPMSVTAIRRGAVNFHALRSRLSSIAASRRSNRLRDMGWGSGSWPCHPAVSVATAVGLTMVGTANAHKVGILPAAPLPCLP